MESINANLTFKIHSLFFIKNYITLTNDALFIIIFFTIQMAYCHFYYKNIIEIMIFNYFMLCLFLNMDLPYFISFFYILS